LLLLDAEILLRVRVSCCDAYAHRETGSFIW